MAPPMRFPPTADVNDFLAEPEPEYNWLVPGLLEYGDRLILTGNEGKGKSTLLRQLGLQIAYGVHPFTLEEMEPRRVLLFDLENPRPAIRREVNKILGGRTIERGRFRIESMPQGMDLSNPVYVEAFTQLLADEQPELLIVGPTYKMAPDLETESGSALLAFQLDQWRTAFKFTLLMESHQPHDRVVDNRKQRPERPYGSSLWLRWPEFGLCLWDNGELRHWRGARDEAREWPKMLVRGGEIAGNEDGWLWEVHRNICANPSCGMPLQLSAGTRPRKFCSSNCSAAARMRQYRARGKLDLI